MSFTAIVSTSFICPEELLIQRDEKNKGMKSELHRFMQQVNTRAAKRIQSVH